MQKCLGFILLAMVYFSCIPKIYYFRPNQPRISEGDTIKLDWKTRKKPILLVHEKTYTDDSTNIKPDERLLEFILTFKHSAVYGDTRVLISPKEPSTLLSIITSTLHGDTLIAVSTNLPEDNFVVKAITSAMVRPLIIWHANKTVTLDHKGSKSEEFHDTPVGGIWQIGTILSAEEKKDHTIAPPILRILVTKKHV
jgi:hypothetical protein